VHKCRGLDGRVRPGRIVQVLSEINADIVALQEVVCVEGKAREDHQARYIAEKLGFHMELGENRRHKGGAYGNVLLSRFPIYHARNYDLSARGRERRGCLRADIYLEDGGWLHIFNLHLGTSFFERREQARKLFRQQILTDRDLPGSKIILGDFNEWTRGLASRLLGLHFGNFDSHPRLGSLGTYPGVFPLLNLDNIYFDQTLKLEGIGVHRSRTALIASDHLPLVANLLIRSVEAKPDANEQRFVSKGTVQSPSNSLSAAS
jgi:endonuclease/exonuclease/phosphatase family metal-dependent hydrolase